jgi:hypothetical protein
VVTLTSRQSGRIDCHYRALQQHMSSLHLADSSTPPGGNATVSRFEHHGSYSGTSGTLRLPFCVSLSTLHFMSSIRVDPIAYKAFVRFYFYTNHRLSTNHHLFDTLQENPPIVSLLLALIVFSSFTFSLEQVWFCKWGVLFFFSSRNLHLQEGKPWREGPHGLFLLPCLDPSPVAFLLFLLSSFFQTRFIRKFENLPEKRKAFAFSSRCFFPCFETW